MPTHLFLKNYPKLKNVTVVPTQTTIFFQVFSHATLLNENTNINFSLFSSTHSFYTLFKQQFSNANI